jgi:hypothetical protein
MAERPPPRSRGFGQVGGFSGATARPPDVTGGFGRGRGRGRDQTPAPWRRLPSSTLGTGLFVVENGAATTVYAIREQTYTDARGLGASQPTFKWVPADVASFEEIMDTVCPDDPCGGQCAIPGCICFLGKCERPAQIGAWSR